jgi:hypothetical protein
MQKSRILEILISFFIDNLILVVLKSMYQDIFISRKEEFLIFLLDIYCGDILG